MQPVALYGQCLAVLHRLFSLAQKAQGGGGTGLGSVESWGELWESLTGLLRLFAVEPLEGASLSEAVCTKALHVFNYVITYGDVFLPSGGTPRSAPLFSLLAHCAIPSHLVVTVWTHPRSHVARCR